jgi:hypothetical protein
MWKDKTKIEEAEENLKEKGNKNDNNGKGEEE